MESKCCSFLLLPLSRASRSSSRPLGQELEQVKATTSLLPSSPLTTPLVYLPDLKAPSLCPRNARRSPSSELCPCGQLVADHTIDQGTSPARVHHRSSLRALLHLPRVAPPSSLILPSVRHHRRSSSRSRPRHCFIIEVKTNYMQPHLTSRVGIDPGWPMLVPPRSGLLQFVFFPSETLFFLYRSVNLLVELNLE
jgi:hypothetical protein